MPIEVTPSREDVAKHVTEHLRDANGARLDDFRESGTPPTRTDADAAITTANLVIRGKVGAIPDTAEGEEWEAVGALINEVAAIYAALILLRPMPNAEPEYDRLKDLYDTLLADTIEARQEVGDGEDPSDSDDTPAASAYGAFPAAMTSLDEVF